MSDFRPSAALATELSETFQDIATHLVSGGRLAFDTRDPDAQGWEAWTKERSHRIVGLPEGDVQHWYQTTHVDEETGLVDFRAHEVGPDGTESSVLSRICFLSQDQIRAMLLDAGLAVENVFRGYSSELVGQGVGALVVTAMRR